MDDRHSRHVRFSPVGAAGQQQIANARVAIIGCGALGSHVAEQLARAGVATASRGLLRIIDRDFVEVSNLQRQALFTTRDAQRSRPKAAAASDHISEIDPSVRVEPHVRDLSAQNAVALTNGVDLLIDGTDNFATRFLINDAALVNRVPWIHAGAVGSRGVVSFIDPPATPCLRCWLDQIPPLGSGETCESVGVLTPLVALVASIEAALALRWLVSHEYERGIISVDVWRDAGVSRRSFERARPSPSCVSCATGELPALAPRAGELVTLCGRNSVQLSIRVPVTLDDVERRVSEMRREHYRHEESLTAHFDEGTITLFDDGRVIVQGTTDPSEARSLIARYLGG